MHDFSAWFSDETWDLRGVKYNPSRLQVDIVNKISYNVGIIIVFNICITKIENK